MHQDNVIMFHELNHEIVQFVRDVSVNKNHKYHDLINKSEFTFDDALYSQYLHIPKLLFRPCTIFVSTAIISKGNEEQTEFIKCADAHNDYFTKNETKHYCTVEQLLKLQTIGVNIGLHGHEHLDLRHQLGNLLYTKIAVETDVLKSVEIAKQYGFKVKSFAYPYNHEAPFMAYYYDINGISKVYGKERISIETLMLGKY